MSRIVKSHIVIGWGEKGKFCPKQLGIGSKLSISHIKRLGKIPSAQDLRKCQHISIVNYKGIALKIQSKYC